ncbi:DUF4038 domain-containing protein [Chondrinema litorale]|uniref:apiosidase-like domain-containing protein n=1 Tax=Chondrinema litorale TaxID=2994555 RepID=UPI002542A315|nr:DUF4038 domain-containing protein [Chondrinema litorale]UZR97360.1 DUF4038 domain-containing protein [Chondrinema litorale]
MKKHVTTYSILAITLLLLACNKEEAEEPLDKIPQWSTYEITLTSEGDYKNPYTDVEVWAVFENQDKETLKRPAFWDGDKTWKLRFAPPDSNAVWTWQTFASNETDKGLNGKTGKIQSVAYEGDNELLKHGLLQMSQGKRNVVHQDKTSFLVVGDTPWSIPFRATKEQVEIYAKDRQQKGFNAALLMSVQPDMKAEGPDKRNTELGFKRGFTDLSDGHINNLVPSYFQYMDTLMNILIDHEIVPVYQPVFHGFGWKGLDVLGNYVEPEEYVRYCKYLLARYGSQPAFWLIAGDNGGDDPGVKESGEMLEEWDAYHQPTGLHYNPCDDYVAPWAVDNPIKDCEHYNKVHQAETWLDFQWAQTGHNGEHLYHKVERMYENKPTKASMNGEPTYEGVNFGQNGLGWWQGEEAWMQLMSGGTMGVVYGAAALWQWKVSPEEEGWSAWASQNKSWKEAMHQEGANYVGLVSKALGNLDIVDIEKRWDLTTNNQPLLAKEDKLYISYLNNGGEIKINSIPAGLKYHWFNPKNGAIEQQGTTDASQSVFTAPSNAPWVLIIGG